MRPIFFKIVLAIFIALFLVIVFLVKRNQELKKQIATVPASSDNENLPPEKKEG